MARLLSTSDGLLISYPPWLMILAIVGVALFLYAARPKARVERRWAVLAVSGLFIWAGIYFGMFRAALTSDGARVRGFILHNDSIAWADAVSATVEQRSGKGGPSYFLMVGRRDGGVFELPLAGLDSGERQLVVAFAIKQVPAAR